MINKWKTKFNPSSRKCLSKDLGVTLVLYGILAISPCNAAIFYESFDQNNPFLSTEKQDQSSFLVPDFINVPQFELDQLTELVNSGLNYFNKGDYKNALPILERAWTMNSRFEITGVIIANIHLQTQQFKLALKVAKQLQNSQPNKPSGYTLAGIAHAGLKQQEQSKLSFQQAFKINPGDLNAGKNLSILAKKEGNTDQAIKILNTMLEHNPDHLITTQELAELEYNAARHNKAIALLESAIATHPKQIQPYILLSRVNLALDKPYKTLTMTEKALTIFPDNIQLFELLGLSQLKMGKASDAVSAFKSAINISPEAVALHYNLAIAYERLKQLMPAKKEVEIALTLEPQNVSAQFVLARLLAKSGKIASAEKMLKKLSASYPDSANIKELEAQIALAKNHPEAAVALYKQALKEKKNNYLNIQLSTAHLLAGKTEIAMTTLRDWLNQYPHDVLTRTSLADFLIAQEKFDEALKHYLKVETQRPALTSVHNNIAWLFIQKKDWDKALKYANKAHEKAPEDAAIADTLAVILLHQGQDARALKLLDDAVIKSPKNQNILFHQAQALLKMQQTEKAKKILKSLRLKNMHSVESSLAQQLIKELNLKK